jgi:hypothetical protein
VTASAVSGPYSETRSQKARRRSTCCLAGLPAIRAAVTPPIGTPTTQLGSRPASAGQAAIFTDAAKATHVIRRIILRQVAIQNYVNPFWLQSGETNDENRHTGVYR